MPDRYFDWTYLDSTHSYEDTKTELGLLRSKMKQRIHYCGRRYGETTPPIRTSKWLGRCAKQWCGVNINSCRSCQRCSGLFELLRGRYCTAALHGEIKLELQRELRAVPLINVLREVSEPIKSKTTSMPDPKVDKRFVHNTHSAIFAGGEARREELGMLRVVRVVNAVAATSPTHTEPMI